MTQNRDDEEKIRMKVMGIADEFSILEIGGYTIHVIIHHSRSEDTPST